MENLPPILQQFIAQYGPVVIGLVGLIFLDVVLGVSAALRTNSFDWSKLADFYKSQVLPGLIGWIGLALTVQFFSPGVLGEETAGVVSPAAAYASLSAVVLVLLNSIRKSAAEIIAPPAVSKA